MGVNDPTPAIRDGARTGRKSAPRLTSRWTRLYKGRTRYGESSSEVRASPRASAPGLVSNQSCITAAFGIENGLLPPGDSAASERPWQHHEVFLHSHIFIIVGINGFRERGGDPCSRYQLLGGWGLQLRQYWTAFARRTLRGRSGTNSVREQNCFPRWRLHRGRHRTGSG